MTIVEFCGQKGGVFRPEYIQNCMTFEELKHVVMLYQNLLKKKSKLLNKKHFYETTFLQILYYLIQHLR